MTRDNSEVVSMNLISESGQKNKWGFKSRGFKHRSNPGQWSRGRSDETAPHWAGLFFYCRRNRLQSELGTGGNRFPPSSGVDVILGLHQTLKTKQSVGVEVVAAAEPPGLRAPFPVPRRFLFPCCKIPTCFFPSAPSCLWDERRAEIESEEVWVEGL